MYEIMLDTNTLDYIYTNKTRVVPKLKNFYKKQINLYITYIQQDEINKIRDISKKNCISKIIGINKSRKYGFIDSKIDMYELVDDTDVDILEKIQKPTLSNPMSNAADLLILYTAVKKKMDYLITDNTSDFEPMLQKMSKFIPNYLKVKKNCNLNYF